ncbi:MAG: zinc ribbon domain-containing protein [Eubacteriales bacterium]|nr:zinc ribbon domain-containing protein [Eubacteriales bacterium]
MANKFCQYCGSSMDENSSFCQSCGKSQTVAAPAAPQSSYSAPTPTYSSPSPSYSAPSSYSPYSSGYNPMQSAKDAPLKVGQYIGMFILSSLPLIGFILLLVWAFSGDTNTNKKNYARAVLIIGIIAGVLSAIFGAVIIPLIVSAIQDLAGSGSFF